MKVFDIEKSRAFQITEYRTQMTALPTWSKDGNHILLFSKDKLEIFSANGTDNVRISAEKIDSSSPLICWDNGKLHLMQNGKSKTIALPNIDLMLNPEPSPDGSKIVFEKYGGNMFVFDIKTQRLTDLGEGNRPQWSPDGEKIVYMIAKDDGYNFTQSDIYAINADGSGKTNLTKTEDLIEMNPCWAPDGKRIAFDEHKTGQIFILKVAPK